MTIFSLMLRNLIPALLVCFLCFSAAAQQSETVSCEEFYKQSKFYLKNIDKKVVLQIQDLNEYSFRVTYDDGAGVKKHIDVYTNANGKSMRSNLQPGDLIKKDEQDVIILVARIANGSMDVKRFDLACS